MRSIVLTVTAAVLTLAGLAPVASPSVATVIAAAAPRQLAATVGFGLPRVPGLPRLPHVPRMP